MFILNEAAGKRKNIWQQGLIVFSSLEPSLSLVQPMMSLGSLSWPGFSPLYLATSWRQGQDAYKSSYHFYSHFHSTDTTHSSLAHKDQSIRTQSSGVILLMVLSDDKRQRDWAKTWSLFCKLNVTLRDRYSLITLMIIIKHSLFIHSLNKSILRAYCTKPNAMSW